MHPLVRAAAAVAVISAIGLYAVPRHPREPSVPSPILSGAPALMAMPCGSRSIPEGDSCVPLPDSAEALGPANAEHHRSSALARAHDLIPRRPDRPSDPVALRYPIDSPVRLLFFGADSQGNEPEDEASAATEGAVDLAAERGAPVKAIDLVGQDGKAEVIALGDLFGKTAVTLHHVNEGTHKRQYLVFIGRFDAFGPDVATDKTVNAGDVLGFAGDSGTPGQVHVHLEIRQVRDDLDVHPLEIGRLDDQSVSIPTDVRNVLPTL